MHMIHAITILKAINLIHEKNFRIIIIGTQSSRSGSLNLVGIRICPILDTSIAKLVRVLKQ